MPDRSRSRTPRLRPPRRADRAAVALRILHFRISADNGRSLYVRREQTGGGSRVPCLMLTALVSTFAVAQPCLAQVLYGSILGDVKDTSGASVPGATVVVTNTSTNQAREAVTDQAGRFTFGDLPAGVYSFKASQQGFKTFEQTEVTVNINSVSRVDVTLEVGSIGDTVTVNAEPARLQTETAEVHQSLLGRGTDQPPRAARPQLSAGLPHAARLRAADQLALDPHQPGAVAGIQRQRHERRPEQHAHRRRQHRARPAAARRLPTSRPSNRFEEVNVVTNSMDAEQGSRAVPRSTCRRGAEPTRFTDRASAITPTSI